MTDNENKKELNNEELEKINSGIKMIVEDDDPEELSWWEKFLKIFFKN